MVDAIYRQHGYEWGTPPGKDLAGACEDWAAMPLAFQPGTQWNYGVSTDVLGRVVEVVSGQPLDQFLAERIFQPLGMTDTTFSVPPGRAGTVGRALYLPPRHRPVHPQRRTGFESEAGADHAFSGGGGLVSSAADYHRFTQMLLGGGALDGARLLGSKTLDYMTRNHLPRNADLHEFGRPVSAEAPMVGTGFGLGFAVKLDAAAGKVLASEGEFGWGGAASTAFWVDPAEEITALFFTQLLPSDTYPLRSQFRTLTYQAVVGLMLSLAIKVVVNADRAVDLHPGDPRYRGRRWQLRHPDRHPDRGRADLRPGQRGAQADRPHARLRVLHPDAFGLFGLIVNAVLFLLVGWVAGKVGLPFEVHGFVAAFLGAILVAVVGFVLHLIIPDRYDDPGR